MALNKVDVSRHLFFGSSGLTSVFQQPRTAVDLISAHITQNLTYLDTASYVRWLFLSLYQLFLFFLSVSSCSSTGFTISYVTSAYCMQIQFLYLSRSDKNPGLLTLRSVVHVLILCLFRSHWLLPNPYPNFLRCLFFDLISSHLIRTDTTPADCLALLCIVEPLIRYQWALFME